jgi:hypothetical protein
MAKEGTSHGLDSSIMSYIGKSIAVLEAAGERGLVDGPARPA